MQRWKHFSYIILAVLLTNFTACSEDSAKPDEQVTGFEKKILDISFEGVNMEMPVEIDYEANTVKTFVLGSVDISGLIPKFELSAETKISPPGGVAYNFSQEMTFQVVAPDKTFKNYKVSVVEINNEIYSLKLVTDQQATAFAIREGIIKEIAERQYEVSVYIHHDDNIADLSAIVETSENAVVSPDPSTVKDYSAPVEYTVSDVNGNERKYKVIVHQTQEQIVTWVQSSEFAAVDGMKMFTSNSSFRFNDDGSPMPFSAYALTIDMSKGFRFVPYYNKEKGNMNVKAMVEDYSSKNKVMPLVGINAGYFGGSSSYSLLINKGELLSSNIPQLSRSGSFYVTRGAFGHNASMNFSADWVYTVEPGIVYGYPTPSPNVDGETPQPKPSESFPTDGLVYDKLNAVGGGPVLIREGQAIDNYGYELFYDDIIRSIANRTAIGATANHELILLVVDGRASYSAGIGLRDMTRILKQDFGCTDALNLDGGGSSTLIINGQVYNQNSIDVGQRSVLTGVLIVKE